MKTIKKELNRSEPLPKKSRGRDPKHRSGLTIGQEAFGTLGTVARVHVLWHQRTRSEAQKKLEREAKAAALALPLKADADKILRYETAVEKQFYRVVNELERLQRQRRSDIVPPPIHIELSTE